MPSPSPSTSTDTIRSSWSQQQRLEFVDFKLRWNGRLNRTDLTDFFGISIPQASLDIARYTELAPSNLEYDRSARVYLASSNFGPLFPSSSATRFLNELLWDAWGARQGARRLLGDGPPAAVLPSPGRNVDADVLVAVHRAIRDRSGLCVVYQSLTRPEPGPRTLSPHAFAHDGYRWHVRAYCHARRSFRDFVIARMLEVQGPAPADKGPEHDTYWRTMVTLRLAPHPKLGASHRRAIELDYGMVGGEVALQCRQALLFYALHHLRLDSNEGRGQQQQIVLKNRREVWRYVPAHDPDNT
jgi:hypothetical protein